MKNMIRTLLICAAFISSTAYAQEAETKDDLLNQLKKEYIQDAIGLSAEDQLKFEKVYEEYELKRKNIRLENRKEVKEIKKKDAGQTEKEISEEDAKKLLMMKFENQRQMLALEEDYTKKMIDSFSAKTVMEYEKADRQFKRELLKMLKDDKPEHEMRNELRQKRKPQGAPKTK